MTHDQLNRIQDFIETEFLRKFIGLTDPPDAMPGLTAPQAAHVLAGALGGVIGQFIKQNIPSEQGRDEWVELAVAQYESQFSKNAFNRIVGEVDGTGRGDDQPSDQQDSGPHGQAVQQPDTGAEQAGADGVGLHSLRGDG